MRFDWQNLGKRLKSDRKLYVFEGYPGSEKLKVYSEGEPTEKITSYIEKDVNGIKVGYYQLNGSEYVADESHVKIVDEDSPDESSFLDGVTDQFLNEFGNVSRRAKKAAGFIGEGFDQAKKKSFFQLLDGAGLYGLKRSLIFGGAFVLIVLSLIAIIKLD